MSGTLIRMNRILYIVTYIGPYFKLGYCQDHGMFVASMMIVGIRRCHMFGCFLGFGAWFVHCSTFVVVVYILIVFYHRTIHGRILELCLDQTYQPRWMMMMMMYRISIFFHSFLLHHHILIMIVLIFIIIIIIIQPVTSRTLLFRLYHVTKSRIITPCLTTTGSFIF